MSPGSSLTLISPIGALGTNNLRTLSDCGQACNAHADCQVYLFGTTGGCTDCCWLKSGTITPYAAAPNVTSYVRGGWGLQSDKGVQAECVCRYIASLLQAFCFWPWVHYASQLVLFFSSAGP